MDAMHIVLAVLAGLGGAAAVWFALRAAGTLAEARAAEARTQHAENEIVRLNAEARAREERVEEIEARARSYQMRGVELEKELDSTAQRHADELRRLQDVLSERERGQEVREREFREASAKQMTEMKATFDALASRALGASTQEFLKLAREQFEKHSSAAGAELDKRREAVDRLVAPIGETLKKTDEKLASMERNWVGDRERLAEQLRAVGLAGEGLRAETGKLVRALREPKVRGMYGEVQLKRVAELAGMREYCDFTEQESTRDGDGNLLRPDMLVRLPSGRTLAVDAKANLKPYLEAIEATEPGEVEEHLREFADGIAGQASLLAKKEYWKQFDGSPEFLVMFVPGDQFVDAALSKRPDLIDLAASQRVILASPSTLIALLRAVHVGFQEQRLAEEARELKELGRELHERASAALEHVARLGGSLEKAVEHFNRFVGSYESRMEPTLRKFEEAGVKGTRALVEVKPVAAAVRLPEGQRLLPGVEESGLR